MNDKLDQLQKLYEQEKQARKQAEEQVEKKQRDFTKLNERLVRLNLDLEKRIARRTEDLEKAHDEAMAIAKSKSEFLANMSHEIRTPLNGVLGMLQAMCQDVDERSRAKMVATALDSGKLLLTIIDDILEFSKFESVGVRLDYVEFDLRQALDSMVHNFSLSAFGKGLAIYSDIDPAMPSLFYGDGFRIQQVIGNFISNAIKFTDKGRIELRAEYLGDGCVRIAVSDTGIGLSPAERRKIFRAFQQADSSVTRRYGGTGLGLSICAKIARALDTQIELESTPGKGSTFTFSIQLDVVNSETLIETYQEDLHGCKIYLIGQGHNSDNLKKLFSQFEGVKFAIFKTLGELQLSHIAGDTPIVVLLDIDKLSRAQRQFCLDLKLLPRPPKIIKLTRYMDLDKRLTFFDEQVLKPVRFDELLAAVSSNLSRSSEQKARRQTTIGRLRCQGKKLLIVDDNMVNLQVAEQLLEFLGFEIHLATSGNEALALVQSQSFDLVLMDVQMPGKDGLTTTREIRDMGGKYAELPIVAMTAHAMDGDLEKSLAHGMDDHICKPIDLDSVIPVITRLMGLTGDIAKPELSAKPVLDWPAFDGFHLQEARERFNGNEQKLYTLLEQFCSAHTAAVERLEALLDQGNDAETKSLLHRLRGSSANLGLVKLASLSANMERSLTVDGVAGCRPYLPEFKKHSDDLAAFRQQLLQLPNRNQKDEQPVLSDKTIEQYLIRIRDNCQRDIVQAEEDLEFLKSHSKDSQTSNFIESIYREFCAFNLDEVGRKIDAYCQPERRAL